MRLVLSLLAVLALLAGPVRADSLSEADRSAFRSIISSQIEAFRADDGPGAYRYAAPIIRQIFPTPERFMDMVRQGYQPVYRPRAVSFGDAGFSASGRPIQRVMLIGPDSISYEAIYTMERQPDGSWQISGCAIVRAPDTSA